MALAATNDYEDALMELESAVAILRRTVDAGRGNARLLRNQIDDIGGVLALLQGQDEELHPHGNLCRCYWGKRYYEEGEKLGGEAAITEPDDEIQYHH